MIELLKHYQVEIIDMGENGEGIGKIEGFTIFIPHTLIGDYAEICITQLKKNYGFGQLIRLHKPSPYRIKSQCSDELECGGCQFQALDYQKQLEWKQRKVENCLKRIGKLSNIKVEPTLGMKLPYYYRNRMQYPIRKVNDQVIIGFFAPKSHQIVSITNCCIQAQTNELIIECIKRFLKDYHISIYEDATHKGLVRHLVIKSGYYTNEIMVCLVINGTQLPYNEQLVERLRQIEGVKSIILNYQREKTSVILGNTYDILYGEDKIREQINGLIFKVSPLAFLQVNSLQTELLYKKVLEFANLTGKEMVIDAYCGIGTITLNLAKYAKKVYGIEIIEDAIKDAKENAKLNHITNVSFYADKAERWIPALYQNGMIADVIVVDPPRKGCDTKLLETLREMQPKRIIYISCNPATLARDLAYLVQDTRYKIECVQPVDMFPHSTHVECVVLMSWVER